MCKDIRSWLRACMRAHGLATARATAGRAILVGVACGLLHSAALHAGRESDLRTELRAQQLLVELADAGPCDRLHELHEVRQGELGNHALFHTLHDIGRAGCRHRVRRRASAR